MTVLDVPPVTSGSALIAGGGRFTVRLAMRDVVPTPLVVLVKWKLPEWVPKPMDAEVIVAVTS